MDPTKVLPCSCKHEFQDSKYGPGKRLHNLAPKKKAWVCTVCSDKKPLSVAEPKKKEEKDAGKDGEVGRTKTNADRKRKGKPS